MGIIKEWTDPQAYETVNMFFHLTQKKSLQYSGLKSNYFLHYIRLLQRKLGFELLNHVFTFLTCEFCPIFS